MGQDQQSENEYNVPVKQSPKKEPALLEPSDVESSLPEHASEDHEETGEARETVTPASTAESAVTTSQPGASVPKSNDVKTTTPHPAPTKEHNGGLLVLQWLTYAFWFFFGVSLCILAGVVINYFVADHQSIVWADKLAYPLASVIVMLGISLVADWFYTKHEPLRKTGASNVIMLLHAVPLVLVAIGSLVTMVFALFTMMLNADPVTGIDGPIQVFLVSMIAAVVFGLAAYRIVFGGRRRLARKIPWVVFVVLSLAAIVAAFVGPVAESNRTKQDRLIEQALPTLSGDIRNYYTQNKKLPATLQDVTHEADSSAQAVQRLIDSKLVTYKPNSLPASGGNVLTPGDDDKVSYTSQLDTSKKSYYQLCTTYQTEKKSEYNYETTRGASYTSGLSAGVASDYRYDYMPTIGAHPAGDVCYNLYVAESQYGAPIEY